MTTSEPYVGFVNGRGTRDQIFNIIQLRNLKNIICL